MLRDFELPMQAARAAAEFDKLFREARGEAEPELKAELIRSLRVKLEEMRAPMEHFDPGFSTISPHPLTGLVLQILLQKIYFNRAGTYRELALGIASVIDAMRRAEQGEKLPVVELERLRDFCIELSDEVARQQRSLRS